MIAVLCALLSGALFFLSTNLGEVWPLAWIAPVPVLWLAFGDGKNWIVAASAFAAVALGATNLLGAYANVFPWIVFVTIFTVPPAAFALVVLGTRLIARRLHPLAAIVAFAALWTSWDFAASFGPDGTAASPAYSQVGMPLLIQSASLFGLWSITFLLGFVAAGLALALRTRTALPAALAIAAFALNAGYGAWRIHDAPPSLRVGLIANDAIADAAFAEDRATALKTIEDYAQAAKRMGARDLIVLPEHVAILSDAWREEARKALQSASDATGATLVIGLDERIGAIRRNSAWVFVPNTQTPRTYIKRRLVPGLERRFVAGKVPLAVASIAIEICKDMDFQAMLRDDAVAAKPRAMAVPAWDFEADAYGHARMAILRGVENGFAMARTARNGLLTLSDPYGRVIAARRSGAGFVMLTGELSRGEAAGRTLYDRIGDAFAWACAALSVMLLVLAFARRPRGG